MSICQVSANPSFSYKYVHASTMSCSSLQVNVFEPVLYSITTKFAFTVQTMIIFVHILHVNSKQHTSKYKSL